MQFLAISAIYLRNLYQLMNFVGTLTLFLGVYQLMSRRDGDLWTLPQGPSSSHQLQFLQAQKMACPPAKDFRAQELK